MVEDRTSEPAALQSENWGEKTIRYVLQPFAMVATPVALLALMTYFVIAAFSSGLGEGVRSFSAVLLPLMAATFVLGFKREAATNLQRISPLAAFFLSFLLGGVVVASLSIATSAPVVELVLAGSFAVLMFSYVTLDRERSLSYFFGMVLGFLVYVVVAGLPNIG